VSKATWPFPGFRAQLEMFFLVKILGTSLGLHSVGNNGLMHFRCSNQENPQGNWVFIFFGA
jgi:hypothetical protein